MLTATGYAAVAAKLANHHFQRSQVNAYRARQEPAALVMQRRVAFTNGAGRNHVLKTDAHRTLAHKVHRSRLMRGIETSRPTNSGVAAFRRSAIVDNYTLV